MISSTYDNKIYIHIACSRYQNCTSLNWIQEKSCSSAMGNFCLHILSKVVDKTSTNTFILLHTAAACLADNTSNNKHNNMKSIQEFDSFKHTDQNSVKCKQFLIQTTHKSMMATLLEETQQINPVQWSIKYIVFREWSIASPNLISCTSHYVIYFIWYHNEPSNSCLIKLRLPGKRSILFGMY